MSEEITPGLSDITQSPRFWNHLSQFGDSVALIDVPGNRQWTYRQLDNEIQRGQVAFRQKERKVAFVFGANDPESVICYLTILASGHVLHFSPGSIEAATKAGFIERYEPDFIVFRPGPGFEIFSGYKIGPSFQSFSVLVREASGPPVHPDLTLLLATSGSTGTPKLVRLSQVNVLVNTFQIVRSLEIGAADRAALNLPMGHISGMTLLHTHICAGGCLVMDKRSIIDRSFWDGFSRSGVTTLAGVPFTFEMLRKIGADQFEIPTLRKMTQAGGKIAPDVAAWLCSSFMPKQVQIFFMYGQSEAGRISILPSELAAAKQGSVGYPLAHSSLDFSDAGEVISRGPNVMLGYAHSREDFGRADELKGTRHTGDLGYLDHDGCLYLTGRLSRFCKILGERIGLDDLENALKKITSVAVISDDQSIVIFFEGNHREELSARADCLAKDLRVPRHLMELKEISAIPRSDSGKVIYSALSERW